MKILVDKSPNFCKFRLGTKFDSNINSIVDYCFSKNNNTVTILDKNDFIYQFKLTDGKLLFKYDLKKFSDFTEFTPKYKIADLLKSDFEDLKFIGFDNEEVTILFRDNQIFKIGYCSFNKLLYKTSKVNTYQCEI